MILDEIVEEYSRRKKMDLPVDLMPLTELQVHRLIKHVNDRKEFYGLQKYEKVTIKDLGDLKIMGMSFEVDPCKSFSV